MKITILGGGIAGLLAAHAFREFKPLLLEAAPTLGGNFLAGGLKYLRRTEHLVDLLDNFIDLPWKPYKPVGLLYSNGQWHEHPKWLAQVGENQRKAMQEVHWVRTRGSVQGFRGDCMNDPLGNGGDVAMKCDHAELIRRLGSLARAHGHVRTDIKVTAINERSVSIDGCPDLAHDLLIPTIPLAALAKLAPWAMLPSPQATKLDVAICQVSDQTPSWDYMYTPTERWITRVTWPEVGVMHAEIPGHLSPLSNLDARNELWDIVSPFVDALHVETIRRIPGHLCSIEGREPGMEWAINWPSNWRPLGRYTQWEPRATSERVLDTAMRYRAELA